MSRFRAMAIVLAMAVSFALFAALPATPASACGDVPCPPPSPCFSIVLDNPRNADRASLCHFTGGTNIVLNEVSLSALSAHLSHHGDCYKKFDEPQVCIP
jgi:hypothetical protein